MSIREPRKTRLAVLMPVVLACLAVQSATAQLSAPPPAINSYVGDPGLSGDPASWRTPEFLRDAGMVSIGAEFAYAAGYSGTAMSIGVVDSGFFAGHLRGHRSLATNYAIGDRYFGVRAQGGTTEETPGEYNQAYNDSHGTHVSGTVSASREGVGETQPTGPNANMHGVAFNADQQAQDRWRALRLSAGDAARRFQNLEWRAQKWKQSMNQVGK